MGTSAYFLASLLVAIDASPQGEEFPPSSKEALSPLHRMEGILDPAQGLVDVR
jgi:hypothetical protein